MALLRVDNKENEVLLNTPNRKEILREGPRMLHASKCGVLGRGAYGTVFKAVFKAKKVAVKIVKNSSDACKQSVRNEMHILGWRHRNVIRVLQIESTPDFGIVIMERFSGQCLQMVLDAVELPLEHRIHISLDMLAGLAYCHKRSLLHLDVKPQNILICLQAHKVAKRNYVCKLCDFGSSLNLRDHQESMHKTAIKGTIRYMAPEALREEPLTPASDVFSLGITMWQLKAQRLPYHWIECNEAVAYQVVKYDIRPDSPTQGLPALVGQGQGKCCCESLSSVVSIDSMQQIGSLLKSGKENRTPGDKMGVSHCDFPLKQPAIIYRRSPLRKLNFKSNYGFPIELGAFDTLHRHAKTPESLLLTSIFRRTSSTPSEQKEQRYTTIYRNCWAAVATSRPSTVELRLLLKELL